MKLRLPPSSLVAAALASATGFARADTAWDKAARLDYDGARRQLQAEAAPEGRGRLALAAALLGAQPRTAANVEQALNIVRALAAETGDDPALRVPARYLEARILQEHLEPSDVAGARAVYRDLLASAPESPLAQQGASALALGLLYDADGGSRVERLAAAEALLPKITLPAAERDLRYVIGRTRLQWALDLPAAREHLRRAAEIGFAQIQRQNSLWVTLGQVAAETGEPALAIRSYRAFLETAVRDTRGPTIRRRLDALLAGMPAEVSR